jgi:hypothetical protein
MSWTVTGARRFSQIGAQVGLALLFFSSSAGQLGLAQDDVNAARRQIQARVAEIISALRSLEEWRGEKMLQIGDINSKLRDSGSPFIPPIILKRKLENE